jgi:hypothetical protein
MIDDSQVEAGPTGKQSYWCPYAAPSGEWLRL